MWLLWTVTDWQKALLSPWLLSGTVSSDLWYFWHIAGTHTQWDLEAQQRDSYMTNISDQSLYGEQKKITRKTLYWRGFCCCRQPVPGGPLWSTESCYDIDIFYAKQIQYSSELQCTDYMTLSTLESLQWPMCQMRTNVTSLRNEEGSYSVPDRVHKQWCNLYKHLMPTRITRSAHLYIGVNTCSFCSLPFFLLFSEDFEGYNSYLCSSVAIFRMAEISGDPQLFLRLFLPLFACLLHLPPFDWISEPLLCCLF